MRYKALGRPGASLSTYKDMPKHEGTRLAGRDKFGSTKMEPPKKDQPPTYKELGIDMAKGGNTALPDATGCV